MLNPKEMKHRIASSVKAEVPIVNYGVLIAAMKGILNRSLQPLGLYNPEGVLTGGGVLEIIDKITKERI